MFLESGGSKPLPIENVTRAADEVNRAADEVNRLSIGGDSVCNTGSSLGCLKVD